MSILNLRFILTCIRIDIMCLYEHNIYYMAVFHKPIQYEIWLYAGLLKKFYYDIRSEQYIYIQISKI